MLIFLPPTTDLPQQKKTAEPKSAHAKRISETSPTLVCYAFSQTSAFERICFENLRKTKLLSLPN